MKSLTQNSWFLAFLFFAFVSRAQTPFQNLNFETENIPEDAPVGGFSRGNYLIAVSDANGATLNSNAKLSLGTAPIITYQTLPTNIVCIYGNYISLAATATAPGASNDFPLFYQWQFNGTNIPGANSNRHAFFATNASGIYTLTVTNAAGSTSANWQLTITNSINVTNDLLLIYNTNSADSVTVLNNYLTNRPGVSNANVLGIGFPGFYIAHSPGNDNFIGTTNKTDYETISDVGFTNQILTSVTNWLALNPTKRPQYVILFLDVPSRVNPTAVSAKNFPFYPNVPTMPSVSWKLANAIPTWKPLVTHINMDGTNDCIAYIKKLRSMDTNDELVISASAGGYGNTNYVLDDIRYGDFNYFGRLISIATNALLSAGVSSDSILFSDGTESIDRDGTRHFLVHPNGTTNVAGYVCWGAHSSLGPTYPKNIQWQGNSGWWLMATVESFNGMRYVAPQGTFLKWFAPSAFGGTHYSNTPVGAVTYVDEPNIGGIANSATYFGLWAAGNNFAICAWNSRTTDKFQAVGDPFVTK